MQVFKKEKPLISYVMVGDGGLNQSYEYAKFLVDSGIKVIELGMPFSDPVADGETILKAGLRALQHNIKFEDVLRFAEKLKRETGVTILVMTYLNPLLHYGLIRAIDHMIEVGIEGVIIPDLPFEHHMEVKQFIKGDQFHLISMVGLNTEEDRLKQICKYASGFIYLVAVKGVTGTQRPKLEEVKVMSDKIKALTKTPVVTGFGIQSAQDIKKFKSAVDGVVIASRFIELREAGKVCEIQKIIGI